MLQHQPVPTITYLATHFPAVSHTFIADEIDALERLGLAVVTVSINTVRDVDRAGDSHGRAKTTRYLKATPRWRAAVAMTAAIARHPSISLLPLRAGVGGCRAILWRYFQLVEAVLLYRVMRRADSTHVHAHFGEAPATIAWYATEVAHRYRAGREHTWSVTIHGWHEFAGEREAMLKEKLAAAQFVACVSDFTRAQLYRIAATKDRSKIHVVRCGISLDHFSPRSIEPHNSPPRLVIVARVSPEKGHLILVDAIAMLRARGLDLLVDVIGPEVDGFGEQVRQHATAAGVGDAFVWHGSLPPDRVATTLAQCNVFCLPTFAEGLPVVIMEAMACGVPVVTTYVAGIPELAVDHETALVIPPARADLLASALAEMLADDDLRHRLVAGAIAAVRRHHDINENVKALAQLFGFDVEGFHPEDTHQ